MARYKLDLYRKFTDYYGLLIQVTLISGSYPACLWPDECLANCLNKPGFYGSPNLSNREAIVPIKLSSPVPIPFPSNSSCWASLAS